MRPGQWAMYGMWVGLLLGALYVWTLPVLIVLGFFLGIAYVWWVFWYFDA